MIFKGNFIKTKKTAFKVNLNLFIVKSWVFKAKNNLKFSEISFEY